MLSNSCGIIYATPFLIIYFNFLFVFRKLLRPTWLVCLRTPTCAPFMPSASPSCPRISSWLAASVERGLKTICTYFLKATYCHGQMNLILCSIYDAHSCVPWTFYVCYSDVAVTAGRCKLRVTYFVTKYWLVSFHFLCFIHGSRFLRFIFTVWIWCLLISLRSVFRSIQFHPSSSHAW